MNNMEDRNIQQNDMTNADKVFKIMDESEHIFFVCLSQEDAEDLLAQNRGKGLKIVEQDKESFLANNKSKWMTLNVYDA